MQIMKDEPFQSWRLIGVMGILLTGIGCFALLAPELILLYLRLYTGYVLLPISVLLIIPALTSHLPKSDALWVLLEGIVDLAIAGVLILNPFLSMVAFPEIIGIWVLLSGIIKIVHSTYMPKGRQRYIFASGVCYIIAGIVLELISFEKLQVVSYVIGIVALLRGISYLYHASRMKKSKGSLIARVV